MQNTGNLYLKVLMEERVDLLKREKVKVKTAFTKKRHKLIKLMDEDYAQSPSYSTIAT